MGEKKSMILQSCRADVRVRRREGKIEIKLLRYKSLVDCLSVDEGGNGSESKSKEFKMLNWEGYVQERYVHWFSITTSDDKKYTFKLKQVPEAAAGGIFWVDLALNESVDFVGVLKNVNTELIEIPQLLAEAPPVKKVPVATYNSVEKTLSFSKGDLGNTRFWGSIVGRIIELGFFEEPIIDSWSDFHDRWIYARIAGFSVEGDDAMVWLTTDSIKTKGKYAKEKVPQALNNVNSGEYYVVINPLYTDGAAFIPTAAGRYSEQRRYFQQGPLSVDIGDVNVVGNGRSRLRFKANDTRRLSFDAATETISSVLSNKYIEEMIKTGENTLKSGIKLHVKTKSGATWVFAMDNLERNGALWEGEALFPVYLSSDDIVNAWLSPSSDTPSLLNFPVGQLCPLVWGMKSIKIGIE